MWRSLGGLLEERRKQSPNKRHIEAANAIRVFQECIRARIPKDIPQGPQAKKLVDGILTVEVVHPALAQLLRHEEKSIIREMTERGCGVSGLVFLVSQEKTEW